MDNVKQKMNFYAFCLTTVQLLFGTLFTGGSQEVRKFEFICIL